MKNKFKYLCAAILISVFAVLSSVSVSAEEYEIAAESNETLDSYADTDATGSAATDNTDVPPENELNNALKAEDYSNGDNFFSKVYGEISNYLGEILCALTFVGSLTVAVAYKKGLLPLIEKSLTAIGNAITKIKDNAKDNAEQNTIISENIQERLNCASDVISLMSEKVDRLEKALNASIKDENEQRREKRQLHLVMNAQIDMLYDVFMSSALPQYQKDAIGEKIAKMKEAIAQNDCE